MNTKQLMTAIQTELRSVDWGSGGSLVFASGSVVVSAAPEFSALMTCISPIAVIRPLDAQMDPAHGEESELWMQRFDVELITVVPGDSLGENPLMGANIASGGTLKSEGKGIFDLEVPLMRAIASLHSEEGVTVYERGRGAVSAVLDEAMGYVAWRNYQFEALISTVPD